MENFIHVRGARQHNLKNIDLDIPKNKLVVFTGVSGSGKSSIAFDTIYAEGQRRYVESLSTYARQFLGIMGKPDVDQITGLSPAISIDQKTVSHNPRSTVGTVTEIYDYLRLLFARVGHPHCPICGREIAGQSLEQIVNKAAQNVEEVLKRDKVARYLILAPLIKDRKGEFSSLFENIKAKGYRRVRVDGRIYDLSDDFTLIKTNKHSIDCVVDRLSLTASDLKDEVQKKNFTGRLNDSIGQALSLSDGLVILSRVVDKGFEMPEYPKELEDHLFSEKFSCPVDNITLPEIEPRTFSFNSPHGACPECTGLGKVQRVNESNLFLPDITIKEGGILPFSSIFEHDTWLSRLLLQVCKKHNIDADVPTKKLSEDDKRLLLEGTGEEEYRVVGKNRFGAETEIYQTFDGIKGELTRRYKESESDYIKASIEKYMQQVVCPVCEGTRLKKEATSITIDGKAISTVSSMTILEAIDWSSNLVSGSILAGREVEIGTMIVKEISSRLTFLYDVGLDYITLARGADSLSGGEAQRIRLASQIGSGLTGVLYVLDEPTIGLHSRDNDKLIQTLIKLRDLGNTVIVVEHDRDVIKAADYVFDFGPEAGKKGGLCIAHGTPHELSLNQKSITGPYLSGKKKIVFEQNKKPQTNGFLTLKGARGYNLKSVDLKLPLGKFICVTGVSGSGKSSLIVETLYHAVAHNLTPEHREEGLSYDSIEGLSQLDKIIMIDQSPIGRTPRSNPATYTKVFDLIRDVYATTREARVLGFKKGRFSFNVKGGRCESCEGQGQVKIEMQFMSDIWISCEVCKGARFNSQTLEVLYRGKNIADVLNMTVADAKTFFSVHPQIVQKLETLDAVGLDYMELGQSATTLSGGEAQRVKLATELAKRGTGKTIYILDEPTTGLHFKDLEKLMVVLKLLVERGNTVLVVEHNLDVVRNADWIIDLGPEGGDKGGKIIAEGTPSQIAKSKSSITGAYLVKS